MEKIRRDNSSLNWLGEEWIEKSSDDDERKERFNDILVEVICENVDFGEGVLSFLEVMSGVRRDEISEKPDVFARGLESLFGKSAKIIEECIIRNLYSTLNIKYEEDTKKSFPELIRNALKEYLAKTQKTI